MKFWEALKAMEEGAVCAYEKHSMYRMHDNLLEFRLRYDPDEGWSASEDPLYLHLDREWFVVTVDFSPTKPAPTKDDSILWTNKDTITFKSPDDVVPIDVHGVKMWLSLKQPSADDSLAKRVGALEREQANDHGWIGNLIKSDEKNCDRLSALESKLAAIERDKAQGTPSEPNSSAPLTSSPASIWPKGSLQWAEEEATKLGMSNVKRRIVSNSRRNVWIVTWMSRDSRHALDWEPCE